jgi:hypothetical protein
MTSKGKSPKSIVRDIKRKTRRVFNAERKSESSWRGIISGNLTY